MDSKSEARALWGRLQNWNLANAIKQKYDLEAASNAKGFAGTFSPVPFGSTVTSTTTNKLGGMLPTAVLSALALAGGGLGLAQLGGFMGGDTPPAAVDTVPQVPPQPAPDNPAPVAPAKPLEPQIIEGTIEWEFDPTNGFSASPKGD